MPRVRRASSLTQIQVLKKTEPKHNQKQYYRNMIANLASSLTLESTQEIDVDRRRNFSQISNELNMSQEDTNQPKRKKINE
jgi:hypothetical protein